MKTQVIPNIARLPTRVGWHATILLPTQIPSKHRLGELTLSSHRRRRRCPPMANPCEIFFVFGIIFILVLVEISAIKNIFRILFVLVLEEIPAIGLKNSTMATVEWSLHCWVYALLTSVEMAWKQKCRLLTFWFKNLPSSWRIYAIRQASSSWKRDQMRKRSQG